jgi:iron complex outermembrane receptor protein
VRAIAKDQWGANFNLPQIPPFRSILASKYVWQFKNSYLSSAYVKAELDYNSQQNHFLSQNNVYAGVDFKLRNAKQSAKLICSGINIFDIAYQSNLSRLKYTARNNATDRNGVFNMGRNISFTFVYNF